MAHRSSSDYNIYYWPPGTGHSAVCWCEVFAHHMLLPQPWGRSCKHSGNLSQMTPRGCSLSLERHWNVSFAWPAYVISLRSMPYQSFRLSCPFLLKKNWWLWFRRHCECLVGRSVVQSSALQLSRQLEVVILDLCCCVISGWLKETWSEKSFYLGFVESIETLHSVI